MNCNFTGLMTFIRDCLDAFLLTACMEVLDIKSLDEKPKRTILPDLLHLQSEEEQHDLIKELCLQILDSFIYTEEGMYQVTGQYSYNNFIQDNVSIKLNQMCCGVIICLFGKV